MTHNFVDDTIASLRPMAHLLRVLSAEMVESAKSGHPGLPLGMADVMTVLWANHMKFNPQDPNWADRDRFVLSAGHGSALLYSALYAVGVLGITKDDLKQFRQLGSRCAGHPEHGMLPGIETTTGPLGQGIANAVGMAIAEAKLAAQFGRDLVDHYTYCMVGDGCLMEGISQEAISLAGHLKLNRLIVFWDDNHVTIDGPTSLSTSENHILRFQACGWHTLQVDGHDMADIDKAIQLAKESDRPTLIACRTVIGYGAPTKQGLSEAHGSPLGPTELRSLKEGFGFNLDSTIDDLLASDLVTEWRRWGQQSTTAYEAWQKRYKTSAHATDFDRWHRHGFTTEVSGALQALQHELATLKTPEATRKSSERCLEKLTDIIPNLLGGSADLTPSNNTKPKAFNPIDATNFKGQYLHYGIREHAMAAIMNGISAHGGLRPYGGTFLCFSDYARPAMRLSALMQQPVVYVMTHDSIGLGEDGPTHQPIEHIASLRSIPNLNVLRPCDAIETAECWEIALLSNRTPSVLALSRQNLPLLRTASDHNQSALGAYVLRHSQRTRTLTLIATGSEVHIATEVATLIEAATDHQVAVVSMPCWELFQSQPEDYQRQVLGDAPIVSIEAGSTFGWRQWADLAIGIDQFGESAPAKDLYTYFDLTPPKIMQRILEWLR